MSLPKKSFPRPTDAVVDTRQKTFLKHSNVLHFKQF